LFFKKINVAPKYKNNEFEVMKYITSKIKKEKKRKKENKI